jgi:uncharacterized surface protein with fasciclin (FAS1) repeats
MSSTALLDEPTRLELNVEYDELNLLEAMQKELFLSDFAQAFDRFVPQGALTVFAPTNTALAQLPEPLTSQATLYLCLKDSLPYKDATEASRAGSNRESLAGGHICVRAEAECYVRDSCAKDHHIIACYKCKDDGMVYVVSSVPTLNCGTLHLAEARQRERQTRAAPKEPDDDAEHED